MYQRHYYHLVSLTNILLIIRIWYLISFQEYRVVIWNTMLTYFFRYVNLNSITRDTMNGVLGKYSSIVPYLKSILSSKANW